MGTVLELDGGSQPASPVIENWYRKKTGGTLDKKKYTYIMGHLDGEIKALVLYSDYTGYSITMDICAPRALTRGLIKEMFDYPFNQLKVTKLFGYIDQRNVLSQRIFTRLGCKHIVEIKDFFGKGIDRYIYEATREDVAKWVTS